MDTYIARETAVVGRAPGETAVVGRAPGETAVVGRDTRERAVVGRDTGEIERARVNSLAIRGKARDISMVALGRQKSVNVHVDSIEPAEVVHTRGDAPSTQTTTLPGYTEKQDSGTKTDNGRETYRPKYVIYLCDSARSCGGWGDRQRGLVSTFLLAHVTGRRFGVNMTSPCDLRRFYQPSQVQWAMGRRRQRTRQQGGFHTALKTVDVDREYPEDVVFVKTNEEHFWQLLVNPHYRAKLPSWALHGKPSFFREAWSRLMKPTQHLQSLLQAFLRQSGYFNRTKPFVCAHVRIGVSRFNPKDTAKRNDVNQLGALWDFFRLYVSNGSDVFMATDHPDVREMSRKKFGSAHHDTGGLMTHVDKTRGDRDRDRACLGFEYTLLDQLVLTCCDVLVTSRSGFSERAALIRGSSENLFRFANGNVTKVTTW
ncbi:uncharacterized protein [Littorina saxatilis]|uniref:uncharacterized protein n=1 Tax=Littorina saxatilis TaxID=31220 RepID=UPI0038B4585B